MNDVQENQVFNFGSDEKMFLLDPTEKNKYSTGVSVTWENLSIWATLKQHHWFKSSKLIDKEIILNATGAVEAGKFVAILGASGSGKSTLMSVLANRNQGNLKIKGDISVGGKQIGGFMKKISGYVYQEDLFIQTLTVFEHLNFTAKLKLDRRVNSVLREKLVLDALYEVGLQNCANRIIGNTGHGKVSLSGGEQKRLSVATELLTDPQLLFCDEPTTGLDSYSALKIITVLKDMVEKRNKTIICSIHQPSEQIFYNFHTIILLHKGRIAFIGTQQDAISYFYNLGFTNTPDQNPAEFLIKCLATEDTIGETSQDIYEKFNKSKYALSVLSLVEFEGQKSLSGDRTTNNYEEPMWIYRLCVLTYRNLLEVKRDPSVQMLRMWENLALSVLLGICVKGTVSFTQHGIQALEGVLFFIITENFFPPIYSVLDHFPNQMPVFYREHSSGTNTATLFLLSNMLSLSPAFIACSVLFTLVVYAFAGLRFSYNAIMLTCLVVALVANTSAAFGIFLSILCPNQQFASAVVTLDTIFMVLSGVLVKLRTVPLFVRWIQYISWFKYGCEAIFIIQLTNVYNISCPSNPNLPCLRSGTEVLKYFDYDEEKLFQDIIFIAIIYFSLIVASYMALIVRSNKRPSLE